MSLTGKKIIIYLDVNPNSSTFNTTREEKVDSADCQPESPRYEESYYCEKDEKGFNTGYAVIVTTDVNVDSPTFGQFTEKREHDTDKCPLFDSGDGYEIDTDFEQHCEMKKYMPSGVEGNTGRFIIGLKDFNPDSEHYGETIESAMTESDWTDEWMEAYGEFPCKAPNTEPEIEEMFSFCETKINDEGILENTGYKEVMGLDKNVYSSTYLTVTNQRIYDERACPTKGVRDKFTRTRQDGTVYKLPCDGNGLLTKTDTFGDLTIDDISGNTNPVISITIGDCVTEIGIGAFMDWSSLQGDLIIPDSVVEIGGGAFSYCSGFNGTLKLPTGITSINNNTFQRCTGLRGILTLPEKITYIGDYSFYECYNFRGKLEIPTGVLRIGACAFEGCTRLSENLVIPDSVEYLGEYAFENCSGFNSLTLGTGVTRIRKCAFQACVGFKGSLTIPNTVRYIDEKAFYDCNGFSGDLVVPDGVSDIGNSTFRKCYGLDGDLTIGNTVKNIGEFAFADCTLLKTVTIGTGIIDIGKSAFQSCSLLTAIYCKATTPPLLGSNAFLSTFCPIYVPNELVDLYKNAPGWSTYASRIVGY